MQSEHMRIECDNGDVYIRIDDETYTLSGTSLDERSLANLKLAFEHVTSDTIEVTTEYLY